MTVPLALLCVSSPRGASFVAGKAYPILSTSNLFHTVLDEGKRQRLVTKTHLQFLVAVEANRSRHATFQLTIWAGTP